MRVAQRRLQAEGGDGILDEMPWDEGPPGVIGRRWLMRRILLTSLAAAVCLWLVHPALAAALKPPKRICWQFTDGAAQFQLLITTRPASGPIAVQNMTYRAYSISGEIVATTGAIVASSISGSGHMNGPLFRFSFTGATPFFSAIPVSATGFWDVSNDTGSIFLNSGGVSFGGVLSPSLCTAIALP